MTVFQAVLVLAAFLCSLVAGFLFAFAVVVMPGIRALQAGPYLQAFQVIDRVIQNNQPLFLIVWVGSALAVVAAALLGFGQLQGVNRVLLIVAAVVYLVCVQGPTIAINIPLNNAVQQLDVTSADEATQRRAREAFESRWNAWNAFRTVTACTTSLLLLFLLLRV